MKHLTFLTAYNNHNQENFFVTWKWKSSFTLLWPTILHPGLWRTPHKHQDYCQKCFVYLPTLSDAHDLPLGGRSRPAPFLLTSVVLVCGWGGCGSSMDCSFPVASKGSLGSAGAWGRPMVCNTRGFNVWHDHCCSPAEITQFQCVSLLSRRPQSSRIR